jgi:hypothetical protein
MRSLLSARASARVQPPSVRAYSSTVMSECPRRRALRREAKRARDRLALDSPASLEFLPEHQAGFRFGCRAAGRDLHKTQPDDRRGFEPKRPSVESDANPGIFHFCHQPEDMPSNCPTWVRVPSDLLDRRHMRVQGSAAENRARAGPQAGRNSFALEWLAFHEWERTLGDVKC